MNAKKLFTRGAAHAVGAFASFGAVSTAFAQEEGEDTGPAATDQLADGAEQAVEDPGGFVDMATEWAMTDGVDIGLTILGAIAVFIIGRMVAGWMASMVSKTAGKRNFDPALTKFFANMVRWAIILFTILGILGMFGVETASFAALVAAMGLAVGLAFQGTLSNFASGILLLVFRPFDLGDIVTLDGETGVVEAIELFTVTLITPNNIKITIPNATACSGKIVNLTGQTYRRIDVAVGVDYSADIDKTREVIMSAVAECEGILEDPAPSAFLAGLGDSAVDWQFRVHCNQDDYWVAHETATRAVKRALDNAGISIPFPQMDVHVDNVG